MRYKKDPNEPSTSKGEVIANSITHGVGFVLSIAGMVILIVRAVRFGTPWHLASFLVFGISQMLLYLASTFYHIFANQPWKAALQRLDHSAIFFLIAGTYTPFLLTTLRNGWGWSIFGIIWGLSILGLILKLSFREKFEKPSVLLYLALGWFGMVVFRQSMGAISTLSLIFLLVGGAAYSAGVIFYRWKSLPYSHAIWHLFVLCGSIFHYFSVLQLA